MGSRGMVPLKALGQEILNNKEFRDTGPLKGLSNEIFIKIRENSYHPKNGPPEAAALSRGGHHGRGPL